MFDRSAVKKVAKAKLQGNYLVLVAASIIVFMIGYLLNTAELRLGHRHGIAFTFAIIKFCISSLSGMALLYLSQKAVKTDIPVSFNDFTTGFTFIKAAIVGNLWMYLWISLWALLILFPSSIVIGLAALMSIAKMFNLSNLEQLPQFFQQDFDDIEDLFLDFGSNFFTMISDYIGICIVVFIVFIIFIIVMAIKGLQYSLMPMILAENKDMYVKKALRLSIELTKGHKGDLFCLCLSFIGWALLSLVPAIIISIIAETVKFSVPVSTSLVSLFTGLGMAFLVPYLLNTYNLTYLKFKEAALESGTVKIEDFQ